MKIPCNLNKNNFESTIEDLLEKSLKACILNGHSFRIQIKLLVKKAFRIDNILFDFKEELLKNYLIIYPLLL